MTAEELAQDMKDAHIDEFGEDAGYNWNSKYFNTNVFVTSPDGQHQTQRSPRYCASDFGAETLADMLAQEKNLDSNVVHAQALGWGSLESGGWVESSAVPFLQF